MKPFTGELTNVVLLTWELKVNGVDVSDRVQWPDPEAIKNAVERGGPILLTVAPAEATPKDHRSANR